MDTIKECKEFYRTHYTLTFFINLFYKFITNILCIIYLLWFCFQIINSQNISEFLNENISNIAFVFFHFIKFIQLLVNIIYLLKYFLKHYVCFLYFMILIIKDNYMIFNNI